MQYTLTHAARYAIVAARIAAVRVLRLARVPWSWFEDFEEGTVLRAAVRAFDFPQVEVVTPVGYRCEHMTITAGGGTLTNVSGWCGCAMQPVFRDAA